ncbi:hypothetical protein LTR93_011386 [Exophiala xenobiotica]|nr:hypothetical protein LTR93_011386 [Exophiala xenobiotica]
MAEVTTHLKTKKAEEEERKLHGDDNTNTPALSKYPDKRCRFIETLTRRSKHGTHEEGKTQGPVFKIDIDQPERFPMEYIKRPKYDQDRLEVLYEIKWLGLSGGRKHLGTERKFASVGSNRKEPVEYPD